MAERVPSYMVPVTFRSLSSASLSSMAEEEPTPPLKPSSPPPPPVALTMVPATATKVALLLDVGESLPSSPELPRKLSAGYALSPSASGKRLAPKEMGAPLDLAPTSPRPRCHLAAT